MISAASPLTTATGISATIVILRVITSSIVTFKPNGDPQICTAKVLQNASMNEMIDQGHDFARTFFVLSGRCTPHHVSGLSILVAVAEARIVKKIGAKPPPTRNSVIERRNRTVAPYFLRTNAAAQTVTRTPKIIATMPVREKLGIIVKARSLAPNQSIFAGPMAFFMKPLGVTLP